MQSLLASRDAELSLFAVGTRLLDFICVRQIFGGKNDRMTMNLFDSLADVEPRQEQLGQGATILRNFAVSEEMALLSAVLFAVVERESPRGYGRTYSGLVID